MLCFFSSSAISPSRSREVLFELSPISKDVPNCRYFSSISVKDLLTTKTQTLTVPLAPESLLTDDDVFQDAASFSLTIQVNILLHVQF